MQQLWNDIRAMLSAPFVGELDLQHLFLLVGLVIVFAALWFIILSYMRRAGQAVAEAV